MVLTLGEGVGGSNTWGGVGGSDTRGGSICQYILKQNKRIISCFQMLICRIVRVSGCFDCEQQCLVQ